MNTVKHFNRALDWIDHHSIPGKGIAVSSRSQKSYAEVTGYLIPTLLAWNEKARAEAYGKWLLTVQHDAGHWGDPNLNEPYVFDTGQIVKGLLALHEETGAPEWAEASRRACDWIVSCIGADGRPCGPDAEAWGDEVPLAVLLYSYSAVRQAGVSFGERSWIEAVDRSLGWFKQQHDFIKFTHLSHFHAYILEALCDLGHPELARNGMVEVEKLQRPNGAVPGLPTVSWVCSTGLFQYAIVWYKLGQIEKGDAAFRYATKLQNRSGGWYGSYGWFPKYFKNAEISWAVKYFLDALRWRLKSSFEKMAPIFSEHIDTSDGRYSLIRAQVKRSAARKVLDAGCGKGRYLRNLVQDFPDVSFHGVDLSINVMETIPSNVDIKQGSLLSLPYEDNRFDFVYSVEALEHTVHVKGALRELGRVVAPGGKLIIIDKNRQALGKLQLPDWEQWFDTRTLVHNLESLGFSVVAEEAIPYEGQQDKLFTAWIASKPECTN